MAVVREDSQRIQTSFLNSNEKKVLVWLAERQPKWMTSDILTWIGTFGAAVVAIGYILVPLNANFLWLSSLGFIINWYGDSLDGTLARVRKTQRPVYGYYIDHTVDAMCEVMIFVGAGLSGLMHIEVAFAALVMYLLLTINVSINAHLKREFKLTYAKMGPTEFRLIMILINTLLVLIEPLREFSHSFLLFGHEIVFRILDYVGVVVVAVLVVMYLVTVSKDMKGYAVADPLPKKGL
ncbi:MAG: CDP-alcohol phosphatidyltransferase family protein [Bacteroidales bacterium]|nr:CDP-alcohol phosphatidyltransferase family protein [Bacteroidales bacterium]